MSTGTNTGRRGPLKSKASFRGSKVILDPISDSFAGPESDIAEVSKGFVLTSKDSSESLVIKESTELDRQLHGDPESRYSLRDSITGSSPSCKESLTESRLSHRDSFKQRKLSLKDSKLHLTIIGIYERQYFFTRIKLYGS